MSPSLIAACIWAVVASVAAMLPQRTHWPAAFLLIACGIPLIGWVTYQNGPYWGMIVLAAGVSILRWPVIYLIRWLRRPAERPE